MEFAKEGAKVSLTGRNVANLEKRPKNVEKLDLEKKECNVKDALKRVMMLSINAEVK